MWNRRDFIKISSIGCLFLSNKSNQQNPTSPKSKIKTNTKQCVVCEQSITDNKYDTYHCVDTHNKPYETYKHHPQLYQGQVLKVKQIGDICSDTPYLLTLQYRVDTGIVITKQIKAGWFRPSTKNCDEFQRKNVPPLKPNEFYITCDDRFYRRQLFYMLYKRQHCPECSHWMFESTYSSGKKNDMIPATYISTQTQVYYATFTILEF